MGSKGVLRTAKTSTFTLAVFARAWKPNLDRKWLQVWKKRGEWVDATPDQIKELKKRGLM